MSCESFRLIRSGWRRRMSPRCSFLFRKYTKRKHLHLPASVIPFISLPTTAANELYVPFEITDLRRLPFSVLAHPRNMTRISAHPWTTQILRWCSLSSLAKGMKMADVTDWRLWHNSKVVFDSQTSLWSCSNYPIRFKPTLSRRRQRTDTRPSLSLKMCKCGPSKRHWTVHFVTFHWILISHRLFDRSRTLDERDRHRINHIFNKLVISIVKYER